MYRNPWVIAILVGLFVMLLWETARSLLGKVPPIWLWAVFLAVVALVLSSLPIAKGARWLARKAGSSLRAALVGKLEKQLTELGKKVEDMSLEQTRVKDRIGRLEAGARGANPGEIERK